MGSKTGHNISIRSKFRNEIGEEERVRISSVRPEASPGRSSHRAVVDRAKAAALMEDVHKPQIGFLVESPNTGQQYYRKYFLNSDHRHRLQIILFYTYRRFKIELQ